MNNCKHEFEPLGLGFKCKKCGWLTTQLPKAEEKPKRKKVSTAKKAE